MSKPSCLSTRSTTRGRKGIHFRNADVQGAAIGKKVARLATRDYLQPVGP